LDQVLARDRNESNVASIPNDDEILVIIINCNNSIDLTQHIPRKHTVGNDTSKQIKSTVCTNNSLFEESPFNPLEEPGSNSPKYQIKDVNGSDDESLIAHNDGWLVASVQQSKTNNPVSSSIDVTWSKTKITFEDIPILFQGPHMATNVNRYFVVEW
jgi:hypothetical protein